MPAQKKTPRKESPLAHPAHIALVQCMRVKPNERVLVVTNPEKIGIAQALYDEAVKIGADVAMLVYPAGKVNGEEPPAAVADAMFQSSVVIAPTVVSISHTNARRRACKEGKARIATLPGIREDSFIRGMSADYQEVGDITKRIFRALNKAKRCHITSPGGTDLELDVNNPAMPSAAQIFKPGDFTNLPDGETSLAPRTANGVLVADSSGSVITEPTRIELKDGFIIKIQGNPSGMRFKKLLEATAKKDRNRNAFGIAELGIGTNPSAKICGSVLEDEKVLGTCHIAFGSNKSFPNGKRHSSIHIDVIVMKPTIVLDSKTIMEKGALLI